MFSNNPFSIKKKGIPIKSHKKERRKLAKKQKLEAAWRLLGSNSSQKNSLIGNSRGINSHRSINKVLTINDEELAEIKAKLRARNRIKQSQPLLFLTPTFLISHQEKNSNDQITDEKTNALCLEGIQQLLMFIMEGKLASLKPRWCKVFRPAKISYTVVIIVNGITANEYQKYSDCFINMRKLFCKSLEVIPPSSYGRTVYEELYEVPISHSAKMKLLEKFQDEETINTQDDIFKSLFKIGIRKKGENTDDNTISTITKTQLLLSPSSMLDNNYPLPWEGEYGNKFRDYVLTKPVYEDVTPSSPLFGLDCEMCLTSIKKNELTMVAIVDEDGELVYHSLVKPPNKIINYLTEYSGVTREMMEPVSTTLKDIQNKIIEILPPDAILCGQSLENDLHALKMMHPYIIDTSLIYNLSGIPSRRSGLKVLTKTFLNRDIQDKSKLGHDPIEDSLASLDLVKLKLEKDLVFGNVSQGYIMEASPPQENPHYYDRKSYFRTQLVTNFFKRMEKDGKKVLMIDRCSRLSKFVKDPVSTMPACKNKHIVQKIQAACSYDITFANLDRTKLRYSKDENEEKLKSTFSKIDKLIHQAYDYCASKVLFITIFNGYDNIDSEYKTDNGIFFVECKP